MKTIPECRQEFIMAATAIVRRLQSAGRGCWIHNLVCRMAIDANRALFVGLPGQTMCAEVLPILKYQ